MKHFNSNVTDNVIEAAIGMCSTTKNILENLQNSCDTCARVSLLMENELWHRYFSVNFAKLFH